MPGPYFFVRNVATGAWGDAGFKMNTSGNSAVPSRHVYVDHNTFVRSSPGTLLDLWYAIEGDHNVPVHDIVFRNNIFSAPLGGQATNANNHRWNRAPASGPEPRAPASGPTVTQVRCHHRNALPRAGMKRRQRRSGQVRLLARAVPSLFCG